MKLLQEIGHFEISIFEKAKFLRCQFFVQRKSKKCHWWRQWQWRLKQKINLDKISSMLSIPDYSMTR